MPLHFVKDHLFDFFERFLKMARHGFAPGMLTSLRAAGLKPSGRMAGYLPAVLPDIESHSSFLTRRINVSTAFQVSPDLAV